ncbi:hypothetical protein ERO13_A02G097300v2 [Gossypium hirsutum]|uniref:Uncharacterized protein n=3 Tax=Gossypium TaxID=3633 RepID=A0A5D3A7X7_GOSMU|nr:hypothetical protein ERO13_A02G097300v2 [Gossypium hirsutum]TYH28071.1 hypothetical protein ES288_A02G115400v1 [Gossypium darwinii]TYI39788.1 hypothetical protein ES332_A02G117800v1 [Gossypium tomentosum]TYJ46269.1 hypothetical protein E1A91_A02G108400v1 [Gossypium mustelinum]
MRRQRPISPMEENSDCAHRGHEDMEEEWVWGVLHVSWGGRASGVRRLLVAAFVRQMETPKPGPIELV